MNKGNFKLILFVVIVNIAVFSLFLVDNSYCATTEIDSKFGDSPVIDGYIDLSVGEWNKASKVGISLDDLPIDLWVLQDDNNLYISVQLELESFAHKQTEFIGLMISNSSSENQEDFIDAKIVQFLNISDNEFNYLDYKINNSVFLNDTETHGNGAAKLDGKVSTYEFSMPIKISKENKEDSSFSYGNGYAFNISYGATPTYPSGIEKSAVVLINIRELSSEMPSIIDLVLYILCIIIFSIIGILLASYVYNILRLKQNIEKYKR
ncbi:MAG: hypothetical protein ACFFEY_14135 [Candidatus Thorarchaeota archaeon]